MTVFSIADRIAAWVDDQLAKEDPLGADEWGRHLTMSAVKTGKGDAIVWVLLVTMRGPFLGQDPIGHTSKYAANVPPEQVVRTGVTRAVEGLRKAFAIKKAAGFTPGNGHNQAGLPPGLIGKKLG